MLQQMTGFFTSAFYFRGTNWMMILLAIAMGFVFGAIWLAPYRPSLFKSPRLWVIAGVSAILTWTAIAFVQVPLQLWYAQALNHFWNQTAILKWILLAGIPYMLFSGLVQETAKLAPVFLYWWRSGKNWTPKFGLIAGAVSGAGFGIFEAVWVFNQFLAPGFSWSALGNSWMGLWERLFSVAFHIAVSALAGYGLAKRKGWRFLLIAALLHSLMNYSIVLIEGNLISTFQEELITAFLAICLVAFTLYLRWRKKEENPAGSPPDETPDAALQPPVNA